MSNRLKIGFIVGSNSAASINLKLAKGLIHLLHDRADGVLLEIQHLPLYNRDMDADYPSVFQSFKDQVRSQDGLVFVTPEYNRSIPAVLKNTLDAGSRPWGKSVWGGVPAAVIGTSPGGAATGMAQQHLRNILAALGMPTLPHPEAFVRWNDGLIDAHGAIVDSSKDYLNGFLTAVLAWTERNQAV